MHPRARADPRPRCPASPAAARPSVRSPAATSATAREAGTQPPLPTIRRRRGIDGRDAPTESVADESGDGFCRPAALDARDPSLAGDHVDRTPWAGRGRHQGDHVGPRSELRHAGQYRRWYTPGEYDCPIRDALGAPDDRDGAADRGHDLCLVRQPHRALPEADRRRRGRQRQPGHRTRDRARRPDHRRAG